MTGVEEYLLQSLIKESLLKKFHDTINTKYDRCKIKLIA